MIWVLTFIITVGLLFLGIEIFWKPGDEADNEFAKKGGFKGLVRRWLGMRKKEGDGDGN